MKRIFLSLLSVIFLTLISNAQKFALVDIEYILKNIPSYEIANQQLNQLSQNWQKEIEAKQNEAEEAYQKYQTEYIFLTDEQKRQREDEVTSIEKAAATLRYKYFGPDGELSQKRQVLIQPIQDEIYNAIKKLADEKGYQAIIDRASASDIIYASPKIDVSNDVLARLGYSR